MLSVKASFYVLLPVILLLWIVAVFLRVQLKAAGGAKTRNTAMCLWLVGALLAVYMLVYVYLTFLTRRPGKAQLNLELFWSYREAFEGFPFKIKRLGLARQIAMNVLLTVPLGLLLPLLFYRAKHPYVWTVLIVLGLSVLTEVLQYLTRMGLCELDDLFDNLLGGLIGIGMLAGGGWLAGRVTAVERKGGLNS